MEEISDVPIPPGNLEHGQDENDSVALIPSNDLASTIWMAGGGAFKKPGEEHALVVSHKKKFGPL